MIKSKVNKLSLVGSEFILMNTKEDIERCEEKIKDLKTFRESNLYDLVVRSLKNFITNMYDGLVELEGTDVDESMKDIVSKTLNRYGLIKTSIFTNAKLLQYTTKEDFEDILKISAYCEKKINEIYDVGIDNSYNVINYNSRVLLCLKINELKDETLLKENNYLENKNKLIKGFDTDFYRYRKYVEEMDEDELFNSFMYLISSLKKISINNVSQTESIKLKQFIYSDIFRKIGILKYENGKIVDDYSLKVRDIESDLIEVILEKNQNKCFDILSLRDGSHKFLNILKQSLEKDDKFKKLNIEDIFINKENNKIIFTVKKENYDLVNNLCLGAIEFFENYDFKNNPAKDSIEGGSIYSFLNTVKGKNSSEEEKIDIKKQKKIQISKDVVFNKEDKKLSFSSFSYFDEEITNVVRESLLKNKFNKQDEKNNDKKNTLSRKKI